MSEPYPVNLVVEGCRCLVVGAGRVAARRAEGLLSCGALVHVVAPAAGSGIVALEGAGGRWEGRLTREQRPYRSGEVAGYRLAVAATDSEPVNRQVRRDGDAAGVWVNRADDASDCSFTVPAVLRRGPLVITVATGGQSPAVSAWLLRRLTDTMGPEYDMLVEMVSSERASRRASGQPTEGLNWQKALDSDMLDLIRSGQVSKARERLQACLSSS